MVALPEPEKQFDQEVSLESGTERYIPGWYGAIRNALQLHVPGDPKNYTTDEYTTRIIGAWCAIQVGILRDLLELIPKNEPIHRQLYQVVWPLSILRDDIRNEYPLSSELLNSDVPTLLSNIVTILGVTTAHNTIDTPTHHGVSVGASTKKDLQKTSRIHVGLVLKHLVGGYVVHTLMALEILEKYTEEYAPDHPLYDSFVCDNISVMSRLGLLNRVQNELILLEHATHDAYTFPELKTI